MAIPSNFFQVFDPLIKAEYFEPVEEADNSLVNAIRPVWIIGDLRILLEWMGAPLRKSNWQLDSKNNSLFRHYKKILLSDSAQSVMIELDRKPCVQFDILPITGQDWFRDMNLSDNDYYMNFLFRENFRDPELFVRGLRILTRCLSYFSRVGVLYTKLSGTDFHLEAQLKTAGFEDVPQNKSAGKGGNIYRFSLEL